MRSKAGVGLATGLFALYVLVTIGVARLLQPDTASFKRAFEDLDNSRYLTAMVLAGTILALIVATVFGWWKQILSDDRRSVGPVRGWIRFLPLIMLVLVVATTDYGAIVDYDRTLLMWIAAASILVGIGEELMFRGNIIVCLRRTPVSEYRVWFISSVLFALIHLGNIVLGAGVFAATANTAMAFLGGTMLYAIRRATGSVLAAIAYHGLWDFTVFTTQGRGYAVVRAVADLVLLIALVASRDKMFATTNRHVDTGAATTPA